MRACASVYVIFLSFSFSSVKSTSRSSYATGFAYSPSNSYSFIDVSHNYSFIGVSYNYSFIDVSYNYSFTDVSYNYSFTGVSYNYSFIDVFYLQL